MGGGVRGGGNGKMARVLHLGSALSVGFGKGGGEWEHGMHLVSALSFGWGRGGEWRGKEGELSDVGTCRWFSPAEKG